MSFLPSRLPARPSRKASWNCFASRRACIRPRKLDESTPVRDFRGIYRLKRRLERYFPFRFLMSSPTALHLRQSIYIVLALSTKHESQSSSAVGGLLSKTWKPKASAQGIRKENGVAANGKMARGEVSSGPPLAPGDGLSKSQPLGFRRVMSGMEDVSIRTCIHSELFIVHRFEVMRSVTGLDREVTAVIDEV